MAEWLYPETWAVGDNMDANTLNRRIRDQFGILLRRPLLVAHNSADQAVSTSSDTAISFDTIDNDDDGMAITGTPATKFYVQRDGAYQFWLNVTMVGNGVGGTIFQTSVWINGTTAGRRWDMQATTTNINGKIYAHSQSGTVFMSAGEYLSAMSYQTTGANITLQASNNSPRLALMWLGVS